MERSRIDGSCTDESTTSGDSISISISPNSLAPFPPPTNKSPESFCRVGSGTSVILDSESGVEAESRKLPSSKYKGVVPQPNGRWGAQIYEKHQRVWLGTFNEEEEAGRAYDIAAQRFRGRDAVVNFKHVGQSEEDSDEEAFLNSHSKPEIVDMLRKHTYKDELEESKRNYMLAVQRKPQLGNQAGKNGGGGGFLGPADRVFKERQQLFEKTVTPSDVGKLNRLVIPKQHAERHFPLQRGSSNSTKGVLLNFEDVTGRVWRFRYSYWNSSQSYVLTKGWSRFVKEKNLKAGDIVSFQKSIGPVKQLYIDWETRNRSGSEPVSRSAQPVQMVRLFGVNIFSLPASSGTAAVLDGVNVAGGCNISNKRNRESDLLSLDWHKKPRIIGAL
uniref:Uncharacterized protein MANES_14G098000 n=1 Tax=Rhizophora mucronata TaxID=61149 RepID=A0A2P2PJY1_RHIMU